MRNVLKNEHGVYVARVKVPKGLETATAQVLNNGKARQTFLQRSLETKDLHWRFLRNREFDVAACSASSYIVAKDQGQALTALPVFLHRRFRHGFVFVNTTKGIRTPADLIGRKVGVKSFLTTAGHWMRGILEHEYGVPHRSIAWIADVDEDVEFSPPADLKLTRLPHDKSLENMLVSGELDAMINSTLIRPIVERDPRIARLFPDYKAEEIAYFKKTGIFPIMHVTAIKQEIVERYPWVPINLFQAFQRAKAIGMKRIENPRLVPLAWYREAWEEQEEILGKDPWEYGLSERNRRIIETLAGYSFEQGLTQRRLSAEDLFVSVSQGRKRGDKFEI